MIYIVKIVRFIDILSFQCYNDTNFEGSVLYDESNCR